MPEQEPASGSILWQGETNQSSLFIHTDEWRANTSYPGLYSPAEIPTVRGWLIHEEQRTGRAKIQPR